MAKIISVDENSIAYELGLQCGDEILEVNGRKVNDILVFRYMTADEEYEITVKKADGTIEIYDIENDFGEDLGVEFENPLMSKAKSCANKCIFCFIDQLPKGMRETLYFKDDDTRLSFLHGNYITMTNISDKELEDMIYIHVSPVNISVHCTDPQLRSFMLGNKKAGRLLQQMKKLADAGIEMNCQIVLCKGINDKENLDNTIKDLEQFFPNVSSICIVPLGMTKHRDGLYKLEPFNKEDCKEIIKQVNVWQERFLDKYESRMVYLADEFYIKGEVPLPDAEDYEDYPQLENGVGMASLFKEEFTEALKEIKEVKYKKVGIVTGTISEELMKELSAMVKGADITVYAIRNEFFGESITVSGLLTGGDIINQLKDKDLGDEILIPENMLRTDTEVFLDDVTVTELSEKLGIKVRVVSNGYDLAEKLTDGKEQ